MARSGEWAVTYPASCELTIAVMYLPAQADATGWGADVRAEVEEWIVRESAARDDWLAAHPPRIEWWTNPVMPFEIDAERADRARRARRRAPTSACRRVSAAWTPGMTARP